MACLREAAVVYSLHGGGSQEVTAWYCEESRYVVFVFQMILLNCLERQASRAARRGMVMIYQESHSCVYRGNPMVRQPSLRTSGVNATWRRSRNLMVRRAYPPVTPLWPVARGQAPAI